MLSLIEQQFIHLPFRALGRSGSKAVCPTLGGRLETDRRDLKRALKLTEPSLMKWEQSVGK